MATPGEFENFFHNCLTSIEEVLEKIDEIEKGLDNVSLSDDSEGLVNKSRELIDSLFEKSSKTKDKFYRKFKKNKSKNNTNTSSLQCTSPSNANTTKEIDPLLIDKESMDVPTLEMVNDHFDSEIQNISDTYESLTETQENLNSDKETEKSTNKARKTTQISKYNEDKKSTKDLNNKESKKSHLNSMLKIKNNTKSKETKVVESTEELNNEDIEECDNSESAKSVIESDKRIVDSCKVNTKKHVKHNLKNSSVEVIDEIDINVNDKSKSQSKDGNAAELHIDSNHLPTTTFSNDISEKNMYLEDKTDAESEKNLDEEMSQKKVEDDSNSMKKNSKNDKVIRKEGEKKDRPDIFVTSDEVHIQAETNNGENNKGKLKELSRRCTFCVCETPHTSAPFSRAKAENSGMGSIVWA